MMKRRRKQVRVNHVVSVTEEPVMGYACYRKGKLVYVSSGAVWIDGRLSNHFTWHTIKPDGSLGKECSGYWRS
jgi:hypothetical protein